jgi:hypothetical protein
MTYDLDKLRTLARFVLENASKLEWSLQGLGMLRLYIGGNTRLHVWDRRFMVPGATPIHDHQQWALHSTVLSGRMRNYRFLESTRGTRYNYKTIRAGYGCVDLSDSAPIMLARQPVEIYSVGDSYHQLPAEIHESDPIDGTVTIMRKFPTKDPDAARVFWLEGGEWGSAEPRPATSMEVDAITQHALLMWSEISAR